MKAVFTNLINKGDYNLADVLKKIDTYHVMGKLTDEDREELYEMARAAAAPQLEYSNEIEKLWIAIRELQAAISQKDSVTEDVRTWVQPTGAHDAYMEGDIILYTDGKTYKSLRNNNVWSPEVMPSLWLAL